QFALHVVGANQAATVFYKISVAFFTIAQCVFHAGAFADIAKDNDATIDDVILHQRRAGILDGDHRAILPPQPVVFVSSALTVRGQLHQRTFLASATPAIVS